MGSTLARISLLAALLGVLVAEPAAAQQYPEPSMSVTVQGNQAVVDGSGCDANQTVEWTLHSGERSNGPVVDAGTTTADDAGQFRFTIDLEGKNGRYRVRAQCGDLVQEASFQANGRGSTGGSPGGQQGANASPSEEAALPRTEVAGSEVVRDTATADANTSSLDVGDGDIRPLASTQLAFTGGDIWGFVVRGLALLAGGVLLVVYRRRSARAG